MVRPKFIAAAAAFLMFEGELMAGKRLLPDFGGSAYVWYSTVLFFQLLVIAGYYGSRQLARASHRARNGILAVLGASGLLTLFRFAPSGGWLPAELQPMTALLPFAGAGVALFCVTPLLHDHQTDPTDYSIYAWSNGGALAGLILYPLVVEPCAGLAVQNLVWAIGVLLICAALPRLTKAEITAPPQSGIGKTRWQWWVLPALSSATMLATTNQIAYETSPGPLAWAVTLALFLWSYVWAFAADRRASIGVLATCGLIAVIGTHMIFEPRSVLYAALLLLAGTTTMLVCHAWLASTKNENSHGFYSAMAAGGAAGSAVTTLIVPHVTDGPVEFPILVLTILSIAGFVWAGRFMRPLLATMAVVAIGSTIAAESSGRSRELARARTLYGCLRVTRSRDGETLALVNNTTRHGEENRRHPEKCWTYYGPESGIAQVIGEKQAVAGSVRVGVVGLGIGTVSRLLRPGDSVVYYEINSKVEELARKYFTCLEQRPATVVIGDGRKLLENETNASLDVLAIDAFSGDAIPTHLLTREAGAVYRRRLKPDGALAVHITNAHVDLLPVVRGLAKSMAMTPRIVKTKTSYWIILTPPGNSTAAEPENTILWTDDRSSILAVLKQRQPTDETR
jgi:hypothetical protein